MNKKKKILKSKEIIIFLFHSDADSNERRLNTRNKIGKATGKSLKETKVL